MKKIHVGFLLSYDYDKLRTAIPLVYEYADKIFIAQDENFTTWNGNKFQVEDSFFSWLQEIDKDHKIEIYKDNFYIPTLNAIQNDTRERHLLSLKMGIGNWLIQIDSDEYIPDFKSFVSQLKKHDHFLDNPKDNPIQVAGFHVDIYKYLDNGLLYVKNTCKVLLATNYPNYKLARQSYERVIYVKTLAFHESLARTEEDLQFKLKNWGHNHELNTEFLTKWKKANKDNFKEIQNVFYLNPKQWKSLGYLPTKDFFEVNKKIKKIDIQQITTLYLAFKNFGQWFKFKFSKPKKQKLDFEKYF